MGIKRNYYGSLCTEMYEILHREAPQDELAFYLSYAKKGMKILEPFCGSGRFLVPFAQSGFWIQGVDNSAEMIEKLLQKLPSADVVQSDIEQYRTSERFDYIFISSGSVSLFTDMQACRGILSSIKGLLKKGGKFVFAVDTVANCGRDRNAYRVTASVHTEEDYQLILKCKSYYDKETHTKFEPAVYELYAGDHLLKQEEMDFQTHLYELGEMEAILQEIGFTEVTVYSSFAKDLAKSNEAEMFLYECSL